MKFITLDTIHWYCEGPESTEAACRHDHLARKCKSVAYFPFYFIVILSNSFFGPSYTEMED